MKYNLNIQLEAMHTVCPEMDVIDAFVLDYIKDWFGSTSNKVKRKIINERMWVWIDLETLIRSIPYIGISEKSVASRRISRLQKFGMLEKNKIGNDLYISLTTKVDLLYNSGKRASVAEMQQLAISANNALSDEHQPLQESNSTVAGEQQFLYITQQYNSPPISPKGDLGEKSHDTGETPEPQKPDIPNRSPQPPVTHVIPMSYQSRSDMEHDIRELSAAKIPYRVGEISETVLEKWGELETRSGPAPDPEELEKLRRTNPKIYQQIIEKQFV